MINSGTTTFLLFLLKMESVSTDALILALFPGSISIYCYMFVLLCMVFCKPVSFDICSFKEDTS